MQFSRSLFLSLLALAGVAGCGRSNKNSGGDSANRVIVTVSSDIEKLNPYTSSDAAASYVQQQIWEPLNFQDPKTLELYAGLASLPVVSDDHLTYTFTMDPKAHWSDGKPVTSDDVIFSFKAALNPKLINIQHLRNYLDKIDSVYNPGGDKSKVEFKLSKATFNDHSVLAGGYVPIMPKHINDPKSLTDKITWADLHNMETTNPSAAEFATWFESGETARDPKYQIGSGAYIFSGWVTNDRLILKLDTSYWAKTYKWREAYPAEIIFKTINDQNASLNALKAREVDVFDALTSEQYLEQLNPEQHKHIRKDTVYYNNISFIAYNNDRPIFKDVRVRKALTALVDRDLIHQQLLKGMAKKIEGPVAPSQPNYNPAVKQQAFDVEAAKKLLDEAGWKDTDGDGILDKVLDGKKTKFSFTYTTQAGAEIPKRILLIIIEQLRKVGIEANLVAPERSVFLENTRSKNYDAAYSGWAGNATEDEIYQLWHSSQAKNKGSNFYSFRNAEADKLMEDIRVEFDKDKRYAMHYRMQEIITQEQPVTFMFSTPLRIGMVDRFDNVWYSRQRPCYDPRYFIARGSGVKPLQPTQNAGF